LLSASWAFLFAKVVGKNKIRNKNEDRNLLKTIVVLNATCAELVQTLFDVKRVNIYIRTNLTK
jgi:hypothetical protein